MPRISRRLHSQSRTCKRHVIPTNLCRFSASCAVRIVGNVYRDMRGLRAGEDVRPMDSTRTALRCVCHPTPAASETAELRTVTCVTPTCQRQEHVYCLFHSKQMPEWSPRDHHCITCRYFYADPFWIRCCPQDVIQPTLIREMHSRPPYLQSVGFFEVHEQT